MTTLLLVRHGETDWNRDRRWQGHTGPPLNEAGRAQAARLAPTITGVDAVYSSDSVRAYETALVLARRHGLEVPVDARLREVNFGLWEGLTRAEIEDRYGDAFSRWLSGERAAPNGGEADATMAQRVYLALDEIAAAHPGGRVVVVTSSGPIRAVEARLRGIDVLDSRHLVEAVHHCALIEIAIRSGTWSYGAVTELR